VKAIVKSKPEKGLWLEEVPIPSVGPNDILLKVSKSAICGTDLHIYKWDEWAQQTIKTPVIIGHEFMGTVVEVGSEVDRVKVGERVTVEGHISCGFCRNCRRGRQHICDNTIGIGVQRNGGFAEYISVPAKNVLHIDNRISDEMMAIMDPLGNATHTAIQSWVYSGRPVNRLSIDSGQEIKNCMDNGNTLSIVDVRTPGETEHGTIPGAVKIPLADILAGKFNLPEDGKHIIYCTSGYRSNIAASYLQQKGYWDVRALAGGFLAWTRAGYPVQQ